MPDATHYLTDKGPKSTEIELPTGERVRVHWKWFKPNGRGTLAFWTHERAEIAE